jgi:phosphomannomutase
MALIKSISGIRGTTGGIPGENLTPVDIVKFTAAYGSWIKKRNAGKHLTVIVGRDARRSGAMINNLVITTLRGMGINVTDLGMATTPTVEIAVMDTDASGGIIITASHNPEQWNALKLLNENGEFLSATDGGKILELADEEKFEFVSTDHEGSLRSDNTWRKKHINKILKLDLVDVAAIKKAELTVAVDCINSVGVIVLPSLLNSLGVKKVVGLNMVPNGRFAHNPEPLQENLKEISLLVSRENADIGFAVDPDVDRLAVICEDGTMFGEEYTLVAVSDYVLRNTTGNTVSNMSSTKALKDITEKYGCSYFSSPVGEVNVVNEMKKRNAVIGGEGNGGVIYPQLHYGRDALVGIALILSHLALSKMTCSELRKQYPDYVIAKKKLELKPDTDFNNIINVVRNEFPESKIDDRDGLKIETSSGWIQLRKSNTEPIMRIYAESDSIQEADKLAGKIIAIVNKL